MNKLFTKIAAVVLGATMATGVGVAVASSAKVNSANAAADTYISLGAGSASNSINTWTVDSSAVTITQNKGSSGTAPNASYISGTNTRFYVGNVFAFVAGTNYKVTGVKFTNSTNSSYYGGIYHANTTWASSSSNITTDDTTNLTLTNCNTTTSGSVSSIEATAGVDAIYISTTKQSRPSKIEVRYTAASVDPSKLSTPAPVYDRANNTITWTAVENATSYELKLDSGSYATATSGYSVASVSVNDAHTVSVKALANGYTTSDEGSVTFHRYATKGTAADPYTVADARRAIDNNDGIADVYVQGYVKAIPTAYDSGYGNITFNLVDNESDTDFVQAFRCTGTDAANVAVHDTALVSGSLTKYNSTYEFAQGCVLQQLTHPVVATTYTIEFNVSGGSATIEDMEVGEGLTFTFPSPGTKTDYLFTGWSSDSGSTYHQAGEISADVYDDATYVAYWQTEGTAADPYTVAEALAAITANAGIKGVQVAGKVSQIGSLSSGALTYYISDDGTTTTQLEVYKGKNVGNVNFTATTDIEVGGDAVVYGNIKDYNGTKEFDSGNYLISYTAPAVLTVTSISISDSMTKTSYTTAEQWDPTGLTVTATYNDSSTADVTSSVAWSYDVASPAVMGVTSTPQTLTITATYQGETDSTTASVSVSAGSYTDTYHLSGSRFIYEQQSAEATKYYMNIDSASASVKPSAVTSKSEASAFLFTLVGNDTYTITNAAGTSGLYQTGSTNTVCWGASGVSYEWVVNDTQAGTLYGTYNLIGQTASDNQRYLCCYNSQDWRTYNSATASNRKAMIQIESAATVSGFSVDDSLANKDVLKNSTFDAAAAAAAGFVAKLNYTDSTYDDVTALATWTLDTSVAGTATLTVSYESYTPVQITDMNIYVAVMTSLTIDASSAKTTGYYTGDTLNTDNLVITAHDASSNDYPLLVSEVTFSPTTLTTAGTITITVTYTNEAGSNPATATGTYTVTVSSFAYDRASSINGGDQVIFGNTAETHYMNGISTTSTKYGTVAAYSGRPGTDNVFTVVAGSADGTVAFKGSDGKYLTWTSGNSLNVATDVTANSSWTVSFDGTVATIANVSDSTRIIRFNSDRFASYASATGTLPTLWKLNGASGQSAAETFAGGFLDDVVNDVCKTNGATFADDMETMWSLYAETYEALSSEAKAYIASKSASASGDDVEKMLYEYKHIYETYGSTLTLANFIGRIEVAKSSAAKVTPNNTVLVDSNNTVALIVVISMISVTAIGGYFFLRKRREEN